MRPSHQEVHGVTVEAGQAFKVGETLVMRPGDQSLGAGADEVIGCRCAVLYQTETRDTG